MSYKVHALKIAVGLALVAGIIITANADEGEDPPDPTDMQYPVSILISSSDTSVDGQGTGAVGIGIHPVFSAVQMDGTPGRLANKAKFQVATDIEFEDVVWSSKWRSITPVSNNIRCDDISMGEEQLTGLTTYHVRVKFKNDEEEEKEKGPWSNQAFSFDTGSTILKATDYLVDGQPTGSSTTGISLNPTFSAIYNNQDSTHNAHQMRVKLYEAAEHTEVWDSGWVNIASLAPGTRGPDMVKTGEILTGLTLHDTVILFKQGEPTPVPDPYDPICFTTGTSILPASDFKIDGQLADAFGVSLKPSFSGVYNNQDPTHFAHQMKVIIYMHSDGTQVWDSGWQNILNLLPGNRGPDIVKTGQPLSGNTDYDVHVHFKQGEPTPVPDPYDPICFTTGPGPIVPHSVFVGSTSAQSGTDALTNPTVDATPMISMILAHQDTNVAITETRFEISLTRDFDDMLWDSPWVAITTNAGSRTGDVAYTGPALVPGGQYFIRVRSKDANGSLSCWSTEEYTFVVQGS